MDDPAGPAAPTGMPLNNENIPPQHQPHFPHPLQAHMAQPNPTAHMQQALAIMNQQVAAQFASLGLPPPAPVTAPAHAPGQPLPFQQNPQVPQPGQSAQPPQLPQLQSQPPSQSPLHQHNFTVPHPHHPSHNHFGHHQVPAHHTSARFMPQGQGNIHMTPRQALQQHLAQQSALGHQTQTGTAVLNQGAPTARSNSAPPPGLGNTTNTVIRETVGPNGERHQSIVASGTFQLNRGFQLPPGGLRQRGTSRPSSSTPGASTPGTPTANTQTPDERRSPREQGLSTPSPSDLRIQLIQSNMMSMELAMNLGTVPPESVQEQIRSLLQSVATIIDQQQYQQLETRRSMLFERASTLRRNQDAQMNRVAEQLASQRSEQRSEESAVYLLSSPSGPQALVISPLGNYTAPWPVPAAPQVPPMGLPNPPLVNVFQNGLIRAQQAQIDAMQLGQAHQDGRPQMANGIQIFPNPQQPHPQPQPLAPGQNLAQQNGQAPNAARDIIRIIIPLGGHLWLLIRLFGFVYFFTHNASWQRTIFLSIVATMLFIAQTGLFQPLLQSIWDPIRRHAEALLPLAGNERPRRGNAPAADNGNVDGARRRNQEPTPEEAAERLLREREAQDGNFLRQSLRRMERAVALFVASLVPGVGERHIAAREAAEAARQQQEREREERARVEAEEANRVEMEAAEQRRTEDEQKTGDEDEVERANKMASVLTSTVGESSKGLEGREERREEAAR